MCTNRWWYTRVVYIIIVGNMNQIMMENYDVTLNALISHLIFMYQQFSLFTRQNDFMTVTMFYIRILTIYESNYTRCITNDTFIKLRILDRNFTNNVII